MLKDSVQSALNDQVKQEFYSAHVYLSMCAWFEDQGLPGFAKWMRFQYQEELGHGIKIFDFINDRDGKVIIEGVEAPPTSWESPLAAFEAAYENEKAVSASIDDLYNLADGERDHATDQPGEQARAATAGCRLLNGTHRLGRFGVGRFAG